MTTAKAAEMSIDVVVVKTYKAYQQNGHDIVVNTLQWNSSGKSQVRRECS